MAVWCRIFVLAVLASCGDNAAAPADATPGACDPCSEPPTFAGLTSAIAASDRGIVLTWDIATDAASSATEITYQVYVATSPGGETFEMPFATVPGMTGPTMSGTYSARTPSATYFFVMRATNAANKQQTATDVEKSATMFADTVPPIFHGITSVTPLTDMSVTLSWNAATDDISNPPNITYEGCCSTDAAGCTGTSFTTLNAVVGATSMTISSLVPATTYYCVVRATDAVSNTETNDVVATGQT